MATPAQSISQPRPDAAAWPGADRWTTYRAFVLAVGILGWALVGRGSALSPAIMGDDAATQTIAAALPLRAVSFFLIAPIFLFFVGQQQVRA